MCIPQSRATCQPIIAHYRPATAGKRCTIAKIYRRYCVAISTITDGISLQTFCEQELKIQRVVKPVVSLCESASEDDTLTWKAVIPR